MVDIVQLGYEVDTAQVLKGDAALDQLTTSTLSADKASKQLGRTSTATGGAIAAAAGQARTVQSSMRGASMQTANLAAQFNDIGVMLASGQSPLILAVQQGTQISQVLNQMGGGRAVIRGLGSAFLSMVNPVSLATLGVIAGGAALAQWALNAGDADGKADMLADSIKDIGEESDAAAAKVRAFFAGVGVETLPIVDRIREINSEIARIEDERLTRGGRQRIINLESERDRLQEQLALRQQNVAAAERLDRIQERANQAGAEYVKRLEAERKAREEAQATLRTLMDQASLNALILRYGEDSLAVARLRAQQERQIFVEQTNSRDISADLKRELIAAYDAANSIAGTDMATAIANAADEAARLRRNLQINATGFGNDFTQLPGEGASAAVAEQRVQELQEAWRIASQPAGRGRRGGGGASDPFEDNLAALIQSLETERETVERWWAENEALLDDRRAREMLGEEEHKRQMLRLEEEYQERLRQIGIDASDERLAQASGFFGAMASLAENSGKGLAKAAAVFGGIEATINAYRAATQALADPSVPFWAKAGAYASVLATGLGAVKAIQNAGSSVGAGGASGVSAAPAAQQNIETLRLIIEGDGLSSDLIGDILSQAQSRNRQGTNIEVVRSRV